MGWLDWLIQQNNRQPWNENPPVNLGDVPPIYEFGKQGLPLKDVWGNTVQTAPNPEPANVHPSSSQSASPAAEAKPVMRPTGESQPLTLQGTINARAAQIAKANMPQSRAELLMQFVAPVLKSFAAAEAQPAYRRDRTFYSMLAGNAGGALLNQVTRGQRIRETAQNQAENEAKVAAGIYNETRPGRPVEANVNGQNRIVTPRQVAQSPYGLGAPVRQQTGRLVTDQNGIDHIVYPDGTSKVVMTQSPGPQGSQGVAGTVPMTAPTAGPVPLRVATKGTTPEAQLGDAIANGHWDRAAKISNLLHPSRTGTGSLTQQLYEALSTGQAAKAATIKQAMQIAAEARSTGQIRSGSGRLTDLQFEWRIMNTPGGTEKLTRLMKMRSPAADAAYTRAAASILSSLSSPFSKKPTEKQVEDAAGSLKRIAKILRGGSGSQPSWPKSLSGYVYKGMIGFRNKAGDTKQASPADTKGIRALRGAGYFPVKPPGG